MNRDAGNPEAYARAALDGECDKVSSATGGRNDVLNDAAFRVGTLVGAGHLGRDEAEHALFQASEASGYVAKDGQAAARDTIRSGLNAGERHPREGLDGAVPERRLPARPVPRLGGAPLPDWTEPGAGGKPKLFAIGKDGPGVFPGELRRHVYRRDGEPVRVKVKNAQDAKERAWSDFYRVRCPSDGTVGWQAKQPVGFVPVPYVGPAETPDPFAAERAGDPITWAEGEKDVDTLASHSLLAFTFGSASDVPDCADLLRGRHVILCADNDEAGERSIPRREAAVGRAVASLSVRRCPGMPAKADATDFFERGGTRETFLEDAKELVAEADGEAPADLALAGPAADVAGHEQTGDAVGQTPMRDGAAGGGGVGPTADATLYTDVPGLLGEVTRWILATARRPLPQLAFGAAVTVLGTLMGRRAMGPTGTGTHLYVVGLAASGAGKQHHLTSAGRLLEAAGASSHIGPPRWKSDSAVITQLEQGPMCLCLIDELGSMLAKLGNRRVGQHEAEIMTTLRELWGLNFAPFRTPGWAGRVSTTIDAPAVSIMGFSNPDEFFAALSSKDVSNGLLNRFLVMTAIGRVADRDPALDPKSVPDDLAERLRALFRWHEGVAINVSLNAMSYRANPTKIEWADDAARDMWRAFGKSLEAINDEDASKGDYLARLAEMAVRLATIRAVGIDGRRAKVSVSDVEWACKVAWASGEWMMREGENRIVEELSFGPLQSRFLDVLRKLGGSASHRDMSRKLRLSIRARGDLDTAIRLLEESGSIEKATTNPSGGGTATTTYRLL